MLNFVLHNSFGLCNISLITLFIFSSDVCKNAMILFYYFTRNKNNTGHKALKSKLKKTFIFKEIYHPFVANPMHN